MSDSAPTDNIVVVVFINTTRCDVSHCSQADVADSKYTGEKFALLPTPAAAAATPVVSPGQHSPVIQTERQERINFA